MAMRNFNRKDAEAKILNEVGKVKDKEFTTEAMLNRAGQGPFSRPMIRNEAIHVMESRRGQPFTKTEREDNHKRLDNSVYRLIKKLEDLGGVTKVGSVDGLACFDLEVDVVMGWQSGCELEGSGMSGFMRVFMRVLLALLMAFLGTVVYTAIGVVTEGYIQKRF